MMSQDVSLKTLVDRGESLASLGWGIIDAHGHIGSTNTFYTPDPGAAAIVEIMDRLGVAMTGISSELAIGSDYARGNDLTAEAVHRFPGRFFGYVTPNPHYADDVIHELERGYDELGLCAIKLHPETQQYAVTDPMCGPIWEFAAARKAVLLSHTWADNPYCRPSMFAELAEAYPQLSFLLGHSGATPEGRREAVEVAKAHKNVYLEICLSMLAFSFRPLGKGEVGADHVIYGTDASFIDPRFTFGKMAYAKLDDKQRRLIMAENISRLLNLRR